MWPTWLSTGCALLSAVLDLAEQKKTGNHKLSRQIIALGCLVPIIAIGLRTTEADVPSPMGGADWLVIVLLYLTLIVNLVFGFMKKEQ